MATIVIMPGGFHPFHAGHAALYQSARRAFPDAEVFVAATNDTSTRPFPFAIKEKLAQVAGVEPGHFVQVKSPFRADEITSQFNPESDQLIFVRSEKDANKPPQAGGTKKNGEPAYLQPLLGAKKLEPFARHAYMAYLPTVEFGPGMTSATEIRAAWPNLDERRKTALVMSLYPVTQKNSRLAANIVKMLDTAIVSEEVMSPFNENQGWAATLEANSAGPVTANTSGAGAGMTAGYQQRENQPVDENTVLVNDPERGIEIRPAGGMGTWSEQALVSSLARQFADIVNMLRAGSYKNIDYVLYRAGAMQAKIDALSRLEQFRERQGRRPIARGREIDLGEDYVEERWSEKYKSSIDCSQPKGFSQRAHCAGRKK
jgi:hypothetical protein